VQAVTHPEAQVRLLRKWLFGNRAYLDIGLSELGSLSQQCFTRALGQGIRETISEVKASRVAALPVPAPGRTRNLDLFVVDGNDFKIRTNYKQVELAPCCFTSSGLQNNSGFESVGRGHQPRPSL